MLDTTNANNYSYITKHLEIHILGGLKTNKLESLRVTISIQKLKQFNVVRQSIDLYNDNQIEKLVRKIEGQPTQKAQRAGHNVGYPIYKQRQLERQIERLTNPWPNTSLKY